MDLRSLAASVLVTALGLWAYHVVVGGRESPPPPDHGARLAALESRIRALEARPDRGERLAEEVDRRLAVLEARDLEVPTPPAASDPSPGSPRDPVGEAREQAARQWREQGIEEARTRIRRLDAGGVVSQAALDRAAALLADHAQVVRDLWEGKENAPPEEREALRRRVGELQEALARSLADVVPEDLARALAGTGGASGFGSR